MNRQAQGVVLLLLGGAVLKASLTDMYLRYVKEYLQVFLIGAGLILVAAGIMAIVYDLRHGAVPDTECADDPDEHAGHDDHQASTAHHEPRVGWLLIAPVLGLLLVAPPALGAYAAGQTGSATLQAADLYPPLPEGDPAVISVVDYATRAVFDKGVSMGERRVQISGFLSPGPDGEQVLTRIMLSCCAADGRPIKIGMTGEVPAGLNDDTWIEVVGVYTTASAKDPVNGQDIPYIEVREWRPIEPPRNPYE